MADYSRSCLEELGPAPSTDCIDLRYEIPTQLNGVDLVFNEMFDYHEKMKNNAEYKSNPDKFRQKCDYPSNVATGEPQHAACLPNQRIDRITTKVKLAKYGNADHTVDWMVICRKYDIEIGKQPDSKFKYFNQGIIGKNRNTGGTCFIDGSEFKSPVIDGRPIRHVDGGKKPRVTDFAHPEISKFYGVGYICTDCHNHHPFIRSPFISQVDKKFESTLGDKSDNTVAGPMRSRVPFWLVAEQQMRKSDPRKEQAMLSDKFTRTLQPLRLQAREARHCTSCHDLGARDECHLLVPQAFGLEPFQALTPFETEELPLRNRMATQVHNFNESAVKSKAWHWKLLDDHAKGNTHIREQYESSLRKVVECCKSPNADGCEWNPPPGLNEDK
jgi:hypothetical protein